AFRRSGLPDEASAVGRRAGHAGRDPGVAAPLTTMRCRNQDFVREQSTPGPSVGIIANPASGKDVHRLVAAASVVDNNEKVNVVRRILGGLGATGVVSVRYMPEHYDIVGRALDGGRTAVEAGPIEMGFAGRPADTLVATRRLVELGVGPIVVRGG